jgi:hypothetical protein
MLSFIGGASPDANYCNLFTWVEAHHPDLASAFSMSCSIGMLSTLRRSGTTLLVPGDEYRALIAGAVKRHDAGAVAHMLKRIIVPEMCPTADRLSRAGTLAGAFIGGVVVDGTVTIGDTVLTRVAVENSREGEKLNVWSLAGQVPEAVATGTAYRAPAFVVKKGGAPPEYGDRRKYLLKHADSACDTSLCRAIGAIVAIVDPASPLLPPLTGVPMADLTILLSSQLTDDQVMPNVPVGGDAAPGGVEDPARRVYRAMFMQTGRDPAAEKSRGAIVAGLNDPGNHQTGIPAAVQALYSTRPAGELRRAVIAFTATCLVKDWRNEPALRTRVAETLAAFIGGDKDCFPAGDEPCHVLFATLFMCSTAFLDQPGRSGVTTDPGMTTEPPSSSAQVWDLAGRAEVWSHART